MNLKQISETLNNFKIKKTYQHNVDQVGHNKFGINYVNIQDRLEILNFEFQNL